MGLHDKTILVTRPLRQADTLIASLKALGANVLHVPALVIVPTAPIEPAPDSDIVIFTSKNAVTNFSGQVGACVLAIGPATAGALKKRNVLVQAIPLPPTSEGLLALPLLKDVHAKRITLVTGCGGRIVLQQKLRDRGANVTRYEVYSRQLPAQLNVRCEQALVQPIDYVVSSSGEGLANIVASCPQIISLKLLVISKRMVTLANNLGFSDRILLAKSASDSAIIQELTNDRYTA